MTFTGQLGVPASYIQLGYGGVASSLPVTPSGVQLPDLQVTVQFGANKRILNGVGKDSILQSIRWASLMPGGHHTLEGNILDVERQAAPLVYRYGATVTLRKRAATPEGGAILWQGYILTVAANDDGTADIVCKGWHHLFMERDEAVLWQDRYYGGWQPSDAEGFTLGGTSDGLSAQVNNSSLGWSAEKGADLSDNDHARLVWYYANPTNSQVLPRRVAGTIHKNRSLGATPDYSLKLERYDGPTASASKITVNDYSGALSNSNTDDTGTNVSDTVSQAVPHPVVAITLYRNGNTASAAFNFAVKMRNLRVNDLAPGDTYLSSDVIDDLAAKMGFTSAGKVTATTDNILPLFWTEGTWWDLVQYLAVAENAKWGVWESNPNPELFFQPWGTGGTTWTANGYSSSATVIAKLQPDDEVYNVVDVSYRKGNSARIRHARVAVSPDPFAGLTPQRTRTYRVALSDTQPDDTLATVIATRLAAEFGIEQLAGTVTASFLTTGGVDHDAYDSRAGDLLMLPDYPGGSRTLRIYGVDHRDDGASTLTIGRVPSRLDRLLFWADQARKRKGKEQS